MHRSSAYTRLLMGVGFKKGESSPCSFYSSEGSICLVVRGDDLLVDAGIDHLKLLDAKLKEVYQFKV